MAHLLLWPWLDIRYAGDTILDHLAAHWPTSWPHAEASPATSRPASSDHKNCSTCKVIIQMNCCCFKSLRFWRVYCATKANGFISEVNNCQQSWEQWKRSSQFCCNFMNDQKSRGSVFQGLVFFSSYWSRTGWDKIHGLTLFLPFCQGLSLVKRNRRTESRGRKNVWRGQLLEHGTQQRGMGEYSGW